MYRKIKILWRFLKQTAVLMIGVPDYDTYLQHHNAHHSDKPAMSYEAFFSERQHARYKGNKQNRCC